MSTGEFWYVLLWSAFFEAIVLGVCVPIIIAVRNRSLPARELRRAQATLDGKVAGYFDQSRELLDEIYSDIKAGVVVAPPELEQRVLDTCALAGDVEDNVGRKAIR